MGRYPREILHGRLQRRGCRCNIQCSRCVSRALCIKCLVCILIKPLKLSDKRTIFQLTSYDAIFFDIVHSLSLATCIIIFPPTKWPIFHVNIILQRPAPAATGRPERPRDANIEHAERGAEEPEAL